MFGDIPFYERFGKVREAGFDFVEFEGWTELDFSRITAGLAENHLQLASMTGSDRHSIVDPEQREEFLEYLSQSIAVARSFGCRNLVINTDADSASLPMDKAKRSDFTKISAATRALLDAAEQARRGGVTLLLKPVQCSGDVCLQSIPSAGDVVKVVNSPSLRLLFDVEQAILRSETVEDAIRRYHDLLGYVRVGVDGDWAKWRKVLVDELHYDGIVGFACRTEGNEDALLKEIREF